ncbi:glycoside hydrolase family 9 [Artemisia annua]|uniref:Endoglucanase n=1 Tax=Artemisia annua TaxID=35608 RepID=A0A2U1PDB4_ARTAN|nr:glycoside hydrolase family 9 [Artemisia annua]
MGGKAGRHAPVFGKYQQKAEFFMCSCVGKSNHNVQKTPGGLIFRQRWNNLQFVTSASFLLTVYADYLTSARRNLQCSSGTITPPQLLAFAKSQVDYILGDNPRATSYMVGYRKNYPQQVHHRASSIVSFKVNPSFVTCRGGYATWFSRKASNPNLLTGAIVGGPDAYDNFADRRDNYQQTEPATYNNAPLLGVLARLNAGHAGYNQLLQVDVPLLKPTAAQPETKVTPNAGLTAIAQKLTSSWNADGKKYYRYSVTVTNKSNKTIKNLNISVTKLYGPLWGLTKTAGGSYGLPTWVNSLPAGKSIELVYIHTNAPAEVKINVLVIMVLVFHGEVPKHHHPRVGYDVSNVTVAEQLWQSIRVKRLSDISALDVKHAKVLERSAHSSPQCRTITSMVELDQHSEFLRNLDTALMPDAKTANHSHNDCIFKETLMPSNEVLSAAECSNVNNNNFIIRETNMNNHLSHGFHTPPMNNNSDLTERKKYRRESFLRWKNSRCKTNTHFASGDCNTPFTTNDFSEQAILAFRCLIPLDDGSWFNDESIRSIRVV